MKKILIFTLFVMSFGSLANDHQAQYTSETARVRYIRAQAQKISKIANYLGKSELSIAASSVGVQTLGLSIDIVSLRSSYVNNTLRRGLEQSEVPIDLELLNRVQRDLLQVEADFTRLNNRFVSELQDLWVDTISGQCEMRTSLIANITYSDEFENCVQEFYRSQERWNRFIRDLHRLALESNS